MNALKTYDKYRKIIVNGYINAPKIIMSYGLRLENKNSNRRTSLYKEVI